MRRSLWIALLALVGLLAAALWYCTAMPGVSAARPPPPFSDAERAEAAALARDVRVLASEIGERNFAHPRALARAAEWIEAELASAGWSVRRETFALAGQTFANVIAEPRAFDAQRPFVLVGAHYDSALGSPGADDNASGVAALLALARRARVRGRPIRLVAFVNEEPPYFQREGMGSLEHARGVRARDEALVAMLSLESLGCYRDEDGSQHYPLPLLELAYPARGDFVAFVGTLGAREFVRRAIRSFRAGVAFPSEGVVLPAWIPGVDWSDHWAFSTAGFPALMITDTAPFRSPHYHTAHDEPGELDTLALARVVGGLECVLFAIATPTP